jgi:small subunit ribosomal protein S1
MIIDQEKLERTTGAAGETNGHRAANNFENMLDAYEPRTPRRGEIVKGEVLKLEGNLAIIDVGAKRDAIVPPQEMEEIGENFLDQLDEGDIVPVYIMTTPVGDEELVVSLEKGQREKDWQRAAEYLDSQETLELTVVNKNKGGLLVKFGRLQGFVPNSHVPTIAKIQDRDERMKQKTNMINSTLPLKVLEIDRRQRRLLLSARAARRELQAERLAALEVGQTVTGRVVNLVNYGAFVDIGGVTGLLHVSELAWHRIDDPAEVLEVGQQIEVVINDVDPERGRVSLSRKPLLPNVWTQFSRHYKKGDLVEGEVTAVVDFGAFILLPFDIEGLAHVSELPVPVSGSPADILQPGERLIVRIVNIEPEEKRVGLSMRQVSAAEELTWLAAQQEEEE